MIDYVSIFCYPDVPAAPDAPNMKLLTPTSVDLTWLPPEDDGGAPILGYEIEKRDELSTVWNRITPHSITSLDYIVENLKAESETAFRVIAVNKAGESKPSEAVALKINPPSAPGAPDIHDVTNTTVTLTWSPPDYNGGSKITG